MPAEPSPLALQVSSFFSIILKNVYPLLFVNHVKIQLNYYLYSKWFEPGSNSQSCSVIIQVRKRTVVGDSD